MQRQEIYGSPYIRFQVDSTLKGLRLSNIVARMAEGLSIRAAKSLIDQGRVFVEEKRILKASHSARTGEWVEVYLDRNGLRTRLGWEDILWEGESLIALNKPPGLLVYGTHGVTADTVLPQLADLLKSKGQLKEKDELRLIHRLDRDTSGLLLVAHDEKTAGNLEKQFRQRQVVKRYQALVCGRPDKEQFHQIAEVKAKRPLSGSKLDNNKNRGRPGGGRPRGHKRPETITEFRVLKYFSDSAWLEARPHTGRTHQIRIHLAQCGHPVLGDILYCQKTQKKQLFRAISRQMLHAASLEFKGPETGERIQLKAPLPVDIEQVLEELKREGP